MAGKHAAARGKSGRDRPAGDEVTGRREEDAGRDETRPTDVAADPGRTGPTHGGPGESGPGDGGPDDTPGESGWADGGPSGGEVGGEASGAAGSAAGAPPPPVRSTEAEPGQEAAAAPDSLADALAQRDEYLDSLRRLQAEFENYRRRVMSQQAEQAARGVALLVDKLLPVLDTLDLAVQHLGDPESAEGKALVATGNQLHDLLAKEGLERIDPLGDVFDPTAHEAVGHVEADGWTDAGEEAGPPPKPVVAQVMRPGYRWKGAVLRPAMVTVRG